MFIDKRSGKIALVAHCILNQNSRATRLVERPSMITEILKFLASNHSAILWYTLQKPNQGSIETERAHLIIKL